MPDWLGYGVPIKERGFLRFEEARTFARSLGIKNKEEWEQWAKSGERPHNIPSNPQYNYKDYGWEGMKDWLGSAGVPPKRRKKFRPFEEALNFAKALGLKTTDDWQKWAASEERPSDIPSTPSLIYKNQGWEGMKDWLGTVDIPHREYRSFDAARSYIHALNLNSKPEWREWCKSGEKPKDIPSNPGKIYLHHGWKGLRDWLGTSRPSKIFRPFKEAKNFVQSLNLQSSSNWHKWVKSDHRPIDIPSTPSIVYQDQGWEGMGDWLGTGNLSPRGRVYKPYDEARLFIHSLDFKSHTEWREWVKSNQRPADIPSVPARTYKGKGWIDWYDWLGIK